MIKLPLTAALLLAAVAAPAAAKEKNNFTHEGVTYVYSQEKVGESTVLQGHAVPGDSFYFVVRKGQVVGKANGIPVSFSVADAVKERDGVSLFLAAR